ncbi:MAG: flagellar basal body P-ring formation chaperone FlgA [Candidatus Marinamargulisbacteria bacterium]
MKFILLNLLFSSLCFSSTFSCIGIEEKIRESLNDLIKKSYPKVRFQSLELKDIGSAFPESCDVIKTTFPKRLMLNNDIVLKLDVYENDELLKRITKIFRINGQSIIYRAKNNYFNGQPISKDLFFEDTLPVNQITQHTTSQKNFDKSQFRNYLGKNQILESWMIEKIPDVKRGDVVKSIVKNDNITLTLDGRVLENGNIGSKIKLKMNDKVFIGKLKDEKTVLIVNN